MTRKLELQTRRLWPEGPEISALGLGTAALGMAYGLPGSQPETPPPLDLGRAVIKEALEAGIRFIDTAPGYGTAERLVGDVVGDNPDVVIATKVAPMLPSSQMEKEIHLSLEASMSSLRRSHLDIVQIHSAGVEHLDPGGMLAVLDDAVRGNLIGAIGATVYDEDAALAACMSGKVRLLQVAYNIFDQRMADKVFQVARMHNVGIVVRSVLMKGALGPGARNLPPGLRALYDAAERLCVALHCGFEALPAYATRFCLEAESVANVLVGASDLTQLRLALEAAQAGRLTAGQLDIMRRQKISDSRLLNPARWAELN